MPDCVYDCAEPLARCRCTRVAPSGRTDSGSIEFTCRITSCLGQYRCCSRIAAQTRSQREEVHRIKRQDAPLLLRTICASGSQTRPGRFNFFLFLIFNFLYFIYNLYSMTRVCFLGPERKLLLVDLKIRASFVHFR